MCLCNIFCGHLQNQQVKVVTVFSVCCVTGSAYPIFYSPFLFSVSALWVINRETSGNKIVFFW